MVDLINVSAADVNQLRDDDLRALVAQLCRLVERSPAAVFAIAPDHLERALEYETRVARRYPVMARVASYWTLSEQIGAQGLTHLDRVLAREVAPVRGEGAFAREHAAAVQQRRLFLIEQGWMDARASTLDRSDLGQLAEREIRELARSLSEEIGKPVHTHAVDRIAGVYARRIDLAQGRVALILGERSGHLVPWRSALERFAGRTVEGVVRGQSLSWRVGPEIGLGRGIQLPPM